MARVWLIAIVTSAAVALCATASAQARTPCPGEQIAPTPLNTPQVSDAVFCLSNQIRAHYGLTAFRRDPLLDAAARLHSADMILRGFFDHTNPDGLTPSARAAAQGYMLGVGENIAYGYSSAGSVVLDWMASAGHCRNMLSGATDLGVGTALSTTAYYTQAFGNYFSHAVDEAPANGCPYALNLATLTDAVAVAPAPASPPPAPPTPAPASTATAKPSLRALSLSPSRMRAGGRGTTISYTLSAGATVTFRVQRAQGRGTHYRTLAGHLTDQGAQGANRLRFAARLRDKALRPGRYRLQAVAANGATGKASAVVRRRFVVVRSGPPAPGA
jgi:uncharacterized protein YkwD